MTGTDDTSRRRLLQALAGATAIGFAGGAATGAYLDDRSLFPGNQTQAGSLTLELAVSTDDEYDDIDRFPTDETLQDTATVPIEFPEVEPGDEGALACAYRVCESPGRVWFRVLDEGGDDTGFGDHLRVRVSERTNCEGASSQLFEGTLTELIDAHESGVQLGQEEGCLGCSAACLHLEWEFDDDPPAELTDTARALELEFAAVQCRHQQPTENPWS